MSRTEIEKKTKQSELAKAVAFARRDGENEVETATRLLGELARLRKLDAGRRPKRKGLPETDVSASFEGPEAFVLEDDDVLRNVLAKGDPKGELRGQVEAEVNTNGTVTVALVTAGQSELLGVGVSKRSPHDDRNDVTGRKQAVVRGLRDLVRKRLEMRKERARAGGKGRQKARRRSA